MCLGFAWAQSLPQPNMGTRKKKTCWDSEDGWHNVHHTTHGLSLHPWFTTPATIHHTSHGSPHQPRFTTPAKVHHTNHECWWGYKNLVASTKPWPLTHNRLTVKWCTTLAPSLQPNMSNCQTRATVKHEQLSNMSNCQTWATVKQLHCLSLYPSSLRTVEVDGSRRVLQAPRWLLFGRVHETDSAARSLKSLHGLALVHSGVANDLTASTFSGAVVCAVVNSSS